MILNLASILFAISPVGNNFNYNYCQEQQSIIADSKNAAVSIGLNNPVDHQNAVRDLCGNVFIIQENEDNGFLVFDPISRKSLEGVMSANCPFTFDESHDNYYLGPMYYYYRIGNTFYHYIDSELNISVSDAYRVQEQFNVLLDGLRNDSSYNNDLKTGTTQKRASNGIDFDQLINTTKYIKNYEFVKNCLYPNNYEGSCGFVAGTVVLHYWDKTVHDGIVDSAFKNSTTGELNSTSTYSPSTNLKDKLVEYYGGSASSGSTARIVSDSINDYCNDYGVRGTASWSLFGVGLRYSIDCDRPAVVFGLLPHVMNGGMVMHAVVCYGYDLREDTYIVNYCWPTFNEVKLGFSLFGETLTFSLDEDYYAKEYIITPSDYGFPSSYAPVELNQNVTLGDLHFSTKRYRCGFIENQYINLSPRKQGFGTAYLDFEFKNPIRSLTINISFWSNKEMYNSTACAYIKSKPLTDTDPNAWIDNIDLLHDIELSKDRNNQTVLNISFPEKTRELRIYAHFNHMPPPTDRNKGRISIGTITIDSYN